MWNKWKRLKLDKIRDKIKIDKIFWFCEIGVQNFLMF